MLVWRSRRACPYLYSDTDIAALIAATGTLRTPQRRTMFATLIGLLAVTGMRVGRGDRAGPRRRRPRGRAGADPPHQARQDPGTGAAPVHRAVGVLRVLRRQPADLLQHPHHLPPATGLAGSRRGRRRAGRASTIMPTSAQARPEALVRGPIDARRLHRRRGRADQIDAAVHLAGSRPDQVDIQQPRPGTTDLFIALDVAT